MIKERHLKMAQNFARNTEYEGERLDLYPTIEGIAFTYPLFEINYASYDAVFYGEELDIFRAMTKIFDQDTMPETWSNFIVKCGRIRNTTGCTYPVDIISGLIFLYHEHLDIFTRLQLSEPNLCDAQALTEMINKILNDPQAESILLEDSRYLIPDQSNHWSDKSPLIRRNRLGDLPVGPTIELGCGVGSNIDNLVDELGVRVLGVDRQFHPDWYKWQGTALKGFSRGDIRRLPIVNDSVRLLIMENVTHHITEESLAEIIREAERVLKDNGILAISPQTYRSQTGSWRFLRKTKDGLVLE